MSITNNNTAKVRWGILGAGRIAEQFARDIRHAASAELVAVASRDLKRAETFAARNGVTCALDNYHALYRSGDIDAIYIATPHTLHLEQSKQALSSGKAVLCEKPVTVNAKECRELIDFADRHSSFMMEALWTYFLPAFQKAKIWVDEGRIGRLRHIKADFGYPMQPYDPQSRVYNRALAGGCLLDMGIYPIAAAWYFSEKTPSAMHSAAEFAPNGVEDQVSMLFAYEGMSASLATSFKCKLPNHCYIIGEEGHIDIPDFWRANQCHLYHGETCIAEFNDDRSGQGFEFEIESASRDILAGRKQSSTMPLNTSLILQTHMDTLRTSFENCGEKSKIETLIEPTN